MNPRGLPLLLLFNIHVDEQNFFCFFFAELILEWLTLIVILTLNQSFFLLNFERVNDLNNLNNSIVICQSKGTHGKFCWSPFLNLIVIDNPMC